MSSELTLIWAQHPNGVKWQRCWAPNFQDANDQCCLAFYETACHHLNVVLATAHHLDLWELNKGIVDALTEAGKKLPQVSKGGRGGHDKVFNLTTKLHRKALVILQLAQQPGSKSDRVCSWACRLAKLAMAWRHSGCTCSLMPQIARWSCPSLPGHSYNS